MERVEEIARKAGSRRIVVALGCLYVAMAAAQTIPLLQEGAPSVEIAGRFVMVAALGIALALGGYLLPEMELRPDLYPRILAWTVGGSGVMFFVVVLLEVITQHGVDEIAFGIALATALGSLGGFAAGIHDSRARTRARELEETVDRLQRSNERLEQFAYATSHDLQEPLRMVSSYLQLVERRYADDLDEEAREFVDYAVDGADRMRRMVASLLEYSQVTTRGEPLEPIDVAAVLDDVLADLQLRIEETDATITRDELPAVTADPDQLAQVFRSLLSNALTYSRDEPPRIHVGTDRVDDEWQFSVADEGVGIDPEYHDRIFNVFEQMHATDGASEHGSGGIGLALCERIVERHGGDIWVESDDGEGTTVYFTIPAPADRRRSSVARASGADGRDGSLAE